MLILFECLSEKIETPKRKRPTNPCQPLADGLTKKFFETKKCLLVLWQASHRLSIEICFKLCSVHQALTTLQLQLRVLTLARTMRTQ